MTLGRRLFVPLATQPFRWFQSGNKQWELRRYGRQYTETHLTPGRRVELRRGYGNPKEALWGTLLEQHRAGSVEEFFDKVPYEQVIPAAESRSHAERLAREILGGGFDVIGFRVKIDHD